MQVEPFMQTYVISRYYFVYPAVGQLEASLSQQTEWESASLITALNLSSDKQFKWENTLILIFN